MNGALQCEHRPAGQPPCERRWVRTVAGARVCLFHPADEAPKMVNGVAPDRPTEVAQQARKTKAAQGPRTHA